MPHKWLAERAKSHVSAMAAARPIKGRGRHGPLLPDGMPLIASDETEEPLSRDPRGATPQRAAEHRPLVP